MKSHGSFLVELSDGSQLFVKSNVVTGEPVIKMEDISFESLRPFTESRPPSGLIRACVKKKKSQRKQRLK